MKKTTLIKTMLLLCALVVGSGSVWAKQYKKVTSASELVDGAKYLIVTSAAYSNASDPVVASQFVTIGEVASNNRKGAVVTVSNDVATATIATETSSTDAHEITLNKNGEEDNWILYDAVNNKYLNGGYLDKSSKAKNYLSSSASASTKTGTSNSNGIWSITITEGSADIVNQNNFHIRFNPNISGSKGSKTYNPIIGTYTGDNATNYTSYFKVSLYKEILEPNSAIDGVATATITYSDGTLTDGVWTMTDNSDYTFQSTTDGKPLGKRSGTVYFKIQYPADYKITVPSTVAVSKIAITGYSTNTSTGTTITVGETSQTIKTESTLYFDIASPSAGADVTFSTAAKEMDIISITLYTATGLTLETSANMDGWRAFYDATQDYTLDANTKAYVVRAKSGTENVVELTKLDVTAIPHGEPVILKTSAGDHKMVLTKTTGVASLGTNLLDVTDGTHNYDCYRLGYKSGTGVAFYKFTATKPAAGIVYLDPEYINLSAGARELTISFADDDVTAIEAVKVQNVAKGEYFNLAGQRVAQPTKGLYIVNGKKVVIK